MKPLIEALRFLTVLPVPSIGTPAEQDFARAARWIPLAGLLIGGLAAGVAWLLLRLPFSLLTAGLLVAMLAAISGGLHLDGLADTADGFLSARSREQILKIMKDPHIGTMGTLALILVLGLKVLALAALGKDLPLLLATVFLAPLLGRCAMAALLAWMPPARPEGLGALFHAAIRPWHAWGGLVLGAGAAFALLGPRGGIPVALAGAVTLWLAISARKKIGGMTGDILGAGNELVELATLIGIALFQGGMS